VRWGNAAMLVLIAVMLGVAWWMSRRTSHLTLAGEG